MLFHCHLVAVVWPSKLLPPGRRKKDGFISASACNDQQQFEHIGIVNVWAEVILHTSAISIRMPFALFLNVGGNNESIANLIAFASPCPSTEIPNRLASDPDTIFVLSVTCTAFQAVCAPEMGTRCVAKMVPTPSCNVTTREPLKLLAAGNRKEKDALYGVCVAMWKPKNRK